MDEMPRLAEDGDEAAEDTANNEDVDPGGSAESSAESTQDKADAEEQSGADEEIDESEVELSEDDLGGGDLFDGIEDSEESSGSAETETQGSDGGDGPVADGLDGNSAAMEEAINDGAARLAVVGLTEEDFEESSLDKLSLETEFRETFEAFRLGYFGSRAVDEYILSAQDEEVDPAWGFCGAMLMAGAMVVWMRPDGEETLGELQGTLERLTGGLS
jgi:hypothetical protein